MDILPKIQCPHTDDPNARNARVDSLSSTLPFEFLNGKISNAEIGFKGFLATFAQGLNRKKTKNELSMKFNFKKLNDTSSLNPLKSEWQKSLTASQDGMWESITNSSTHWEIQDEQQTIGYTCVDGGNRLLQFFVLPNWLTEGLAIFQQFIDQQNIKTALIGTNNPVGLSIAMHFQKSVKVDTYLFTDFVKSMPNEIDASFRLVMETDLPNLVEYFHQSMGAPKEWLKNYAGSLIEKKEIFVLEDGAEILGTCEVRKSKSDSKVADVGMVVSPNHRRKGIGTFLLGKAKEIAIKWGRSPICSCEKDNLGSLKSIQKNGFRSVHQMLLMDF